jgi:hypothetical protein
MPNPAKRAWVRKTGLLRDPEKGMLLKNLTFFFKK